MKTGRDTDAVGYGKYIVWTGSLFLVAFLNLIFSGAEVLGGHSAVAPGENTVSGEASLASAPNRIMHDHDFSRAYFDRQALARTAPPGIRVHVNKRASFVLRGNFPNPFNPNTTIIFDMRKAGPVRLAVYSSTGQHMVTLLEGHLEPGTYYAEWDGRDKNGVAAVSGTYFIQLQTAGERQSRRMTLVK